MKKNKSIDRVMESDSENFIELVRLSGLNPRTDFKEVDLSGVDFGAADLRLFRFSGSNLDNSDLSNSRISRHTLEGASVMGARLPSNTTRTNVLTCMVDQRDIQAANYFYDSLNEAFISTLEEIDNLSAKEFLNFLKSSKFSRHSHKGHVLEKVQVVVNDHQLEILNVIKTASKRSMQNIIRTILGLSADLKTTRLRRREKSPLHAVISASH